MKEDEIMEAPEKIYIHPDIGGREFLRPWLHRPANNESVEYTRTDAFIEKALDWIEDNVLSSNQQDKSRLYFEQFKKYMEGE